MVKLYAPHGIQEVLDTDGKLYQVAADGSVDIPPHAVGGLLQRGFVVGGSALSASLKALGIDINMSINYPLSNPGTWQVKAAAFTSPDDALQIGYNCDNSVVADPVITWTEEINYPVTVRGITNTRTLEQYRSFKPDTTETRTLRPLFHSYVPGSGGGNGFINYGYQLIGDGYLSTPGGGGHYFYTGNDASASNITIGGWDFDGFKPGNINCMVDSYLDISAVTAANPMVVTLSSVSSLLPGANLEFWSVDAASLANKGYTRLAALAGTEIKIVSISGSAVTTDYNNTGAAVTTAHKCKRPQTLKNTYQGAFQKLGINRTIPSSSTDVFSVAGPVSFYASPVSFNDISAAAQSVLSFNKIGNQSIKTANSSAAYALGHSAGNTNTFVIGPAQNTDSNFGINGNYHGLSVLSVGDPATSGWTACGLGGSVPAGDERVRIRGGTASIISMSLNTCADFTGTVAAGSVALWAATDGSLKIRFGTTTKTITAA